MSQIKHVLHVIDALDYGGAQMLLVALAEKIPKDLYRMTVCVLQPYTQLKERLESNGVNVFCLQRTRPSMFQPHKFLCYIVQNIKDIISICKQTRVNVIHCHLSDAEFLGTLAGIFYKAESIITTNHYPFLPSGRWRIDPRNILRQLLCWGLYNQGVDWVVAVSGDIADKLIEYYRVSPEKIRIIINGINVDSFRNKCASDELRKSLGLRSTDKVLTTIGRLTTQKGHTYLVDAMHSLSKKGCSIKLLVVGEGELKEQLIAQTNALEMENQIQFLGRRSDIADILAISDIFVFPSFWEGTSLALLEAMASGKIILATAEPGNMAVIQHGVNGYLVSPGDPAALADAIMFLLENPNLAAEYAHNAFVTAKERYDIEQTINGYELLWTKPSGSNSRRECRSITNH
jgi:glycosyltransferase involved in cell wall biosynthesis